MGQLVATGDNESQQKKTDEPGAEEAVVRVTTKSLPSCLGSGRVTIAMELPGEAEARRELKQVDRVLGEVKELLRKNDMIGIVAVCGPGAVKTGRVLDASWTILEPDPEVEGRARPKADPSEAQLQYLTGGLLSLSDLLQEEVDRARQLGLRVPLRDGALFVTKKP